MFNLQVKKSEGIIYLSVELLINPNTLIAFVLIVLINNTKK